MKPSQCLTAAFVGAVAITVTSVAPSQAVDYSLTQDCATAGTVNVSLTVGDTYTITNAGGTQRCTLAAAYRGAGSARINSNPLVPGSGNQIFGAGDQLVYSATTAGGMQIDVRERWTVSYVFTVTGGPGPSGSDESAAGPADIVQQVEAPAAGCGQIQRADLNWSGVASGGWGASWAQWVKGGRGGAVCTRTLSFAAGAWKVAGS